MIAKFKKYWEEIHGVMVIVIVLDPRHKFKLIEYFFPQIYGDRFATEIEKVRKLCSDLLKEYESSCLMSPQCQQSSDQSISSSSQCPLFTSDYVDPIFNYDSFVSSTSSTENVKSKLDIFV